MRLKQQQRGLLDQAASHVFIDRFPVKFGPFEQRNHLGGESVPLDGDRAEPAFEEGVLAVVVVLPLTSALVETWRLARPSGPTQALMRLNALARSTNSSLRLTAEGIAYPFNNSLSTRPS